MASDGTPLLTQPGFDDMYDPDNHQLPSRMDLACPDCFSCLLNVMTLPCTILGSSTVVKPNEEVILLKWGKFYGVIREPGLYFISNCGIEKYRVSLRQHTNERMGVRVNDCNSVPVVVSGVCVYRVKNVMKAAFGCDSWQTAVNDMCDLALKEVCAEYPFGLSDEKPSLRSSHNVIAKEMVAKLQPMVEYCGVEIMSFAITDLTVGAQMQQAMLAKSKAVAMTGAKEAMVVSSVKVASEAVALLEKEGHTLSPEGKEKVLTNLLTVMISGESGASTSMMIGGAGGA